MNYPSLAVKDGTIAFIGKIVIKRGKPLYAGKARLLTTAQKENDQLQGRR